MRRLKSCEISDGKVYLLHYYPYQCMYSRAGRLYLSSINLIEAVLITTSDAELRKRLQEYCDKIHAKYEICRQRAEEVGEVW